MYCIGKGVPMDYAQGVGCYEQAAQAGHALAQYNLAVMLSKGQGCEADPARAGVWFEKAAEQGVEQARAALAGQAAPRGVATPESTKSAAAVRFAPASAIAEAEVSAPATSAPKIAPPITTATVGPGQSARGKTGGQATSAPPPTSACRTESPKLADSGDQSPQSATPVHFSEPEMVGSGRMAAVRPVHQVTTPDPLANEPAPRNEPRSSAPPEALAHLTELRRSPVKPRPHLVPRGNGPDLSCPQTSETATIRPAAEPECSRTPAGVADRPADLAATVANAHDTASEETAPHSVAGATSAETADVRAHATEQRARTEAEVADQRDVEIGQTDPWMLALIQKLKEIKHS
jgi:hypothetical protein